MADLLLTKNSVRSAKANNVRFAKSDRTKRVLLSGGQTKLAAVGVTQEQFTDLKPEVLVSGTSVSIVLNSVARNATNQITLTAFSVAGVDQLGSVVDNSSAELATDTTPGTKFNGNDLSTIDASLVSAGQKAVCIVERGANGNGNLFVKASSVFEQPGPIFIEDNEKRAILLTVKNGAPTTGLVSAIAHSGTATDYPTLSIVVPAYSYTLASADPGQEIRFTLTSGQTSKTYAVTTPALGEIYVAPPNKKGSDEFGTGSISSPFATPNFAASKTSPGDTVYFRPGTYPSCYPTISGTSGNPITFTTLPGEERLARIEGNLRKHTYYGGQGALPAAELADAFRIDTLSWIVVENLTLAYAFREGIYIRGGDAGQLTGNHVIRGNQIEFVGAHGIFAAGERPEEQVILPGEAMRLENVLVENNFIRFTNVVTDYNDQQINGQDPTDVGGSVECLTFANGIRNSQAIGNIIGPSRQYGIDFKTFVEDCIAKGNHIFDVRRYGIYIDAGEHAVRRLLIADNLMERCNHAVTLAREEDTGVSGDNVALEDIAIVNNVAKDIRRSAYYLSRHPKDDQDIGYYRRIQLVGNTSVNCNTDRIYAENSLDDILAFGLNGLSQEIVEDIFVAENIAFKDNGQPLLNRTTPDARFEYAPNNVNYEDGVVADIQKPFFRNPIIGDFTIDAERTVSTTRELAVDGLVLTNTGAANYITVAERAQSSVFSCDFTGLDPRTSDGGRVLVLGGLTSGAYIGFQSIADGDTANNLLVRFGSGLMRWDAATAYKVFDLREIQPSAYPADGTLVVEFDLTLLGANIRAYWNGMPLTALESGGLTTTIASYAGSDNGQYLGSGLTGASDPMRDATNPENNRALTYATASAMRFSANQLIT